MINLLCVCLTFIIPPATHTVILIHSLLDTTHALFEGIVWCLGNFTNFQTNPESDNLLDAFV